MATASVLHLGRSSLGEARRVETWDHVLHHLGYDTTLVPVLANGPRPAVSCIRSVASGAVPPDGAIWPTAALKGAAADVIVCVTGRTWRPAVEQMADRVVVDLVDLFSINYRARLRTETRATHRILYRTLARRWDRFEDQMARRSPTRIVTAGRKEAGALGVRWVPNIVANIPRSRRRSAGSGTALFFGTLSYGPNIEALQEACRLWPQVREFANGPVPLTVAGRGAGPDVRQLVAANDDWTLLNGFDTLDALFQHVDVAICPLISASGIQNKVLEAAAYGVPQVITPTAAAGLDDQFPVVVASGAEFAAEVASAVARPAGYDAAAADHLRNNYSTEAVAHAVAALLK